MLKQILAGVPGAEIIRKCRDLLLSEYMSVRGLTDKREALIAYLAAEPPRDWFLSLQDIANIRRDADKQTWRFAENTQFSVRIWADQNQDKVLYLHEQGPLEGTDDYQHFEAAQHAAAASRQSQSAKSAPAQPCADEEAGVAAASDVAEILSEAPLEAAFYGADNSLDSPDSINLDRDDEPHFIQGSQPCLDPSFSYNPYNWSPFSIAVMDPSSVQAAIKWGHQGFLQLDSTHGCNAQKFPLYTLLAVDGYNKGIPLAYLICSSEREDLIQEFLEKVTSTVSPRGPRHVAQPCDGCKVDFSAHHRQPGKSAA